MADQPLQTDLGTNKGMLMAGGVLIGVAGLAGFAGMLLLGSAAVSATRRWVQQLQQPPTQLAKHKWRQARAATTAGAQAWRSSLPAQPSSSPAVASSDSGQ
jgi:hypothetical protein